ncbi:MAG: SDR family NAD(P)-dependent oxidoreductase [Bdellovibrionota bacterium]
MATDLKNKWALITGASSGIGHATATVFAQKGMNLLITGRRQERLDELKKQLEKSHGVKVEVLVFDIQDYKACEATLLPKIQDISLSLLVNNSGLAKGVQPLQDGAIEDWEQMIDTNIKGLLYMTRLVLPHMIKNKSGHIVNLGSVAGRWTYPGGAVYSATKFAVRGISESLRMDLLGTPIRVTNIEPGMVETEFSDVRLQDKEKAKKVYQGVNALKAEDIAETIAWCVERPGHVNIQELVIYPTQQAGVGPSYTFRNSSPS